MNADGLRDEVAAALHGQGVWYIASDDMATDLADAVLPVLRRHIDAAREQVAETIVREIEATEHRCGDCGVLLDGTYIADIAREHGKGDGDD